MTKYFVIKNHTLLFIIANKIGAFPDFLLNDVVILYAIFYYYLLFIGLYTYSGEKDVVKRGISTFIFRNSPVV